MLSSTLIFIILSRMVSPYWINSNDGSTILIGSSFHGGSSLNGFFNSLLIPNVSITSSNGSSISINFYLIGSNVINKYDINTFIEWSSTNLCNQGFYGTDNIENISFSSTISSIFYRCGFLFSSNIVDFTLKFEYILKYEIHLNNYNDLTWILQINSINNDIFTIYIPEDITNYNINSHFYVNNSLQNIQILQNITNYIFNINRDCVSCHYINGTEPSLWDFDEIYVNNTLNWYFIQEFYPQYINIKYLTSFHIGMYCNLNYYFIPRLLGLSSGYSFTENSLNDYVNGIVNWPINNYFTQPLIPIIYGNEYGSMRINIENINLNESDYYIWILELHIIDNETGICVFQRTSGKQNIEYIFGNSMQTVIPVNNELLIKDYQDFYITMEGVPFYKTTFTTTTINISESESGSTPIVTVNSTIYANDTEDLMYNHTQYIIDSDNDGDNNGDNNVIIYVILGIFSCIVICLVVVAIILICNKLKKDILKSKLPNTQLAVVNSDSHFVVDKPKHINNNEWEGKIHANMNLTVGEPSISVENIQNDRVISAESFVISDDNDEDVVTPRGNINDT